MDLPTPLGPIVPWPRRALASRVEFDFRGTWYMGAAMLGLGVVLPHLPGHPGLSCPLRELTGVPCPFCGLTTSVEAVLHGDGHSALAANPFGLVVVALSIALLVRPQWRRFSLPTVLLGICLASSWVFELHRYHFL